MRKSKRPKSTASKHSIIVLYRRSVLIGDHLSVCALEFCYVVLRKLILNY
jgi:hypothetical protein